MDKEMLQKVLDFIREGATAASGPAKWGFEQVCAYRVNQEIAWLVCLSAITVLMVLVIAFSYNRCSLEGFDPDGGIADNVAITMGALGLMGLLVCVLCILTTLPESYAVIKNPEGAVLSRLSRS